MQLSLDYHQQFLLSSDEKLKIKRAQERTI